MTKPITITVANHKGGVGKSTTAVTLATGLAALGYPTVLVDCDPQGNVAQFLNLEQRPALYELVIQEKSPAQVLQQLPGYDRLGVVSGNADTLEIEIALNAGRRFQTKTALTNALQPFRSNGRGKTTLIIIDTAPSLSSLQVSAINAADWLLIPAHLEYASETGISALAEAAGALQRGGHQVKILGILPTMVDSRVIEHKETMAGLRKAFAGLLLHPTRRLIALAEAPRFGLPIWTYNPAAAKDYSVVLKQVIERTGA